MTAPRRFFTDEARAAVLLHAMRPLPPRPPPDIMAGDAQ